MKAGADSEQINRIGEKFRFINMGEVGTLKRGGRCRIHSSI